MSNSEFTIDIIDTKGNPVARGTECMAQVLTDNGTLVVYQRTETDISLFVELLRQSGCKDALMLDPKLWEKGECKLQAASKCSSGTGCGAGKSCQKTGYGGATWCECL